MKKLLLVFALFAGAAGTATITHAQVRVNVNIGSLPLWGPAGFDNAQYYYLPDVGAYYNVSNQQFIYQEGGQWVFRTSLPGQYRNYDLYNGYKVVINDRDPWLRNQTYVTKYRSFRGRHGQAAIRDSRDSRYYQIANHPHHNEWRGGNNNNKGGGRNQPAQRNDSRNQDQRGGQNQGNQQNNNGGGARR